MQPFVCHSYLCPLDFLINSSSVALLHPLPTFSDFAVVGPGLVHMLVILEL